MTNVESISNQSIITGDQMPNSLGKMFIALIDYAIIKFKQKSIKDTKWITECVKSMIM